MTEEQIHRVADVYLNFQTEDKFSSIATVEDILANDAKLSIPLYVQSFAEAEEKVAVEDAIAEWIEASAICAEECQSIVNLIEGGKTDAV